MWRQLGSVTLAPSVLTWCLTMMVHLGNSKTGTKVQPQDLRPQLKPQSSWRGLAHGEGEIQHPPRSCSRSLGPGPTSDRAVVVLEPWRSPGSYLALTLALLNPAQPPIKVVVARSPGGKIQSEIISDSALLPKLLGIDMLQRDTPTQGYAFKTGVDNCFT